MHKFDGLLVADIPGQSLGNPKARLDPSVEDIKLDCGTWNDPPLHAETSHMSFGDQGTTATVDLLGNLMQFSQYLGNDAGNSGMFCVDHSETDQPYYVTSRAEQLNEIAQGGTTSPDINRDGLCLAVDLSTTWASLYDRTVTWTHWRWPRIKYRLKGKSLVSDVFRPFEIQVTVQWMIRKQTVLHQIVVENVGSNDYPLSLSLNPDMLVRDLDPYKFNGEDKQDPDQYITGLGPHNYGWYCIHKLNEPVETNTQQGSSYAATAVVGVFKNGQALKFEKDTKTSSFQWTHNWAEKTQDPQDGSASKNVVEFVAAYKLIKMRSQRESWKNFVIPAESSAIDSFLSEESRPFDFFLSQLDVDSKLAQDRPNRAGEREPTTRVATGTGEPAKEPHEDLVQDTMEATDRPNGSSSRPMPDPAEKDIEADSKRAKSRCAKYSSPSGVQEADDLGNHIEFAVRRNLEHILTVCAIHLVEPGLETDGKDEPKAVNKHPKIALTCGDLSGHSISHSASL